MKNIFFILLIAACLPGISQTLCGTYYYKTIPSRDVLVLKPDSTYSFEKWDYTERSNKKVMLTGKWTIQNKKITITVDDPKYEAYNRDYFTVLNDGLEECMPWEERIVKCLKLLKRKPKNKIR